MVRLAAVGSIMEPSVGWVCAARQKACVDVDVADAAGGSRWEPSPCLTHAVLGAVTRRLAARCRGWGVGLTPPHLLPPARVPARFWQRGGTSLLFQGRGAAVNY